VDAHRRILAAHGAPSGVPLRPLSTAGRLFLSGGQPWRWMGVSAFQLLDRYANGENIGPFLAAYRGYNLLRVWPYVPVADWGTKAWDVTTPEIAVEFLARVARDGFAVEFTALTDDAADRLAWAQSWIPAVSAAKPTNLVWEAGNEPKVHKNIDTLALKPMLEASGLLYASGDSSAQAFGPYCTVHTERDQDWPRRAHDLLEYWTGGGPDAPTDPAHKCPAVADEPIRPDQAGYVVNDYRGYAGACSLLGAGITFHSETGKYGQPPTPDEARCAAATLEALTAFPADAPNGPYRRIDEVVDWSVPESQRTFYTLRTYAVGNYMVRIRPTRPDAYEPGWHALDADGILWTR